MSNVAEEFNAITEHFSPRVIAMANGQYFKLANSWASFRSTAMPTGRVLPGPSRRFTMCYRDREVGLKAGDFHVVPRGVEHRPRATEEAWVMFVEPAETKHTGDAVTDFTKSIASRSRIWRNARQTILSSRLRPARMPHAIP